jgi:acyl carrier protein
MNARRHVVKTHDPENGLQTIVVMKRVLTEHFGIADQQLALDQPLDAIGLDSLSFVEYVFELEKALNITLPDVPRDIGTVGALVAFIDSEVASQSRNRSPA